MRILNESMRRQTVQDYTRLFLRPSGPHTEGGFFNVVLNEVAQRVPEGWVIVLDDDAVLTDANFVANVARAIAQCSEDDVVFFSIRIYPQAHVLPKSKDLKDLIRANKMPPHRTVDMASLIVHRKHFATYTFTSECSGDYRFLLHLNASGLTFRFIDDIGTGIW